MSNIFLIITNVQETNNYSKMVKVTNVEHTIDTYMIPVIPTKRENDRFEYIYRCETEDKFKFMRGEINNLLISNVTITSLDSDEEFISRSYTIIRT